MTERERLIGLLEQAKEKATGTIGSLNNGFGAWYADYLLANGVIVPPCKVGDTVYKICPKCNERHNGSCENCAWCGCLGYGCDIGVRVYSDGSYNEHTLQIVPRKVTKQNIITIFELWNIMYFSTEEEANGAKSEYDAIRKTKDRTKRYKRYGAWEKKRKTSFSFLKGGEG